MEAACILRQKYRDKNKVVVHKTQTNKGNLVRKTAGGLKTQDTGETQQVQSTWGE